MEDVLMVHASMVLLFVIEIHDFKNHASLMIMRDYV